MTGESRPALVIPAVREMWMAGVLTGLPGVVCVVLAVFGLIERENVFIGLAVATPVFVGTLWLITGRRLVWAIVGEAGAVPDDMRIATPEETRRRVARIYGPWAAFVAVLLVLSPSVVGMVIGGSLYLLLQALRLKHYEDQGQTFVHRPRYRWRGTGSRRTGRGWFDPADFYVT